jgi:hypothetical protein
MPSERLALALERIAPADWSIFERFAAEFLAVEYPSLRTTASQHGDKGRDGELYAIDEEPRTFVQYSVAQDWRAKIRATIARLKETMPNIRALIYATNQTIGPDADDLVTEIRRKDKVSVDIRDRNWFIEREVTHAQRQVAAAELARHFVDPLLVERGVRSFAAPALSKDHAKVAFVHLALERDDATLEKGWTKSCFESLVLAALHDTSDANRMPHEDVLHSVSELLPSGYDTQISEQVAGALRRLSGRNGSVRQKRDDGSYFLSYDERSKLGARIASFALREEVLKDQLIDAIQAVAPKRQLSDEQWSALAEDMLRGLETVLLRRGEAFAQAVTTGQIQQVSAHEILDSVEQSGGQIKNNVSEEEIASAIIEVLERPSSEMREHLRRMADAYTMYAFLRQTPDVQRAVMSIFSGGEIWLDTNVILPVLAETLLDDPNNRYYTTIFRAALDAGIRLYITDGVLEEVESHLNLSLAYARTQSSEWRNRVPFIYAAYALSGRARSEFANWLENFCGRTRPLDDIRDYMAEVHGIDVRNLREEAEGAAKDLRGAIQRVWYGVHERRRSREDSDLDRATVDRLISHDVENCLGVIELRKNSPGMSPMSYRQWFLTLDKTALYLRDLLKNEISGSVPESPALSPDFMTQYLRLASIRTAVERELRVNLPLLTDISRYEFLPRELIDRADELRQEMSDVDERIVRRRIRDELDRLKLTLGPQALAGIRGMEDNLNRRINSEKPGC